MICGWELTDFVWVQGDLLNFNVLQYCVNLESPIDSLWITVIQCVSKCLHESLYTVDMTAVADMQNSGKAVVSARHS